MGQAQAVNANKANESQFEVSERADDNLNEPPPVCVKKVLCRYKGAVFLSNSEYTEAKASKDN